VSEKSPKADLTDLRTVIARQKVLGQRLLWLLLVPFAIASAIIPMFFVLNNRLADLEVLTKQLNIERYLLMDRNYALAVDQYQEIARRDRSAPVLARLGILQFQLDPKNRDLAIQTLEEAQRLDPQYWETYRNLTYIYTSTDETKKAIESGKKALDLNGNDAITLNNLAWVYSTAKEPALRDLGLAQRYAEKALRLTGLGDKKAQILDTLAEVHFRKGGQGDLNAALDYHRSAIALAPPWDVKNYQDHLRRNFPREGDSPVAN
jgi:tetratricopeptide (TPR) repeat protein